MSRLFKIYLIFIGCAIFLSFFDNSIISALASIARIGCFLITVYYAFRIASKLLRKFLWRIRRKLILSYVFIGVVPIFLLFILVIAGFYIFMGQATSEMFNTTLDSYILQTRIESEKLLHAMETQKPEDALERWYSEMRPEDREWLKHSEISVISDKGIELLSGEEKVELPGWLKDKDFSGLVSRDSILWLTAIHHDSNNNRSLQIHVPITADLLASIQKRIGADIRYISGGPENMKDELQVTVGGPKQQRWAIWWDFPVIWLSLPDQYNWSTGKKISLVDTEKDEKGNVNIKFNGENISEEDSDASGTKKGDQEHSNSAGVFSVNTNVSRVFNQIFSRSTALQKAVYIVMAFLAGFFLVIELLSLISGLLLARSITASVHNLFEGTRRIQSGDLNYKIRISAKDQLGDLAVSFNTMTDSLKALMKDQAEKERLAEALRIARQMQENLLPKEVDCCRTVEISAMNVPAQEVCGDYYDVIRRNDQEVGIIVADVSGKGPSAALYMAEVKGVMMSLSTKTMVPRQLLVEANNILAPTLDPRSFITMTYAMIDEPAMLMKMSRAGHNPVLHYEAASAKIDIVQPKGIGLGLSKNGIFENSLEEVERKLQTGDILVFYTDGLTEAMDSQNAFYGLDRLSQIVVANKHLSADEIKHVIYKDLEQFLNRTLPQDDVTLVLLKVR